MLLVVLAGFLAGCENKYKDPDPQAMGYEYFPLEIGDYRIYDVTDIRFTSNVGDTTRFQMRERVDTSFTDQTNQLVYKVVRSIRFNPNSAWIDDSVLVAAKLDNMVLLTKNNTKYVKLVFPVKEGGEWIGDLYNDRIAGGGRQSKIRNDKEVYTYSSVGRPYQEWGLNYPNTITVSQDSTSSTVIYDKRQEVYAEAVGLIYRLANRLRYCEDTESKQCSYGTDYIVSGHERHEVLVSHGKM